MILKSDSVMFCKRLENSEDLEVILSFLSEFGEKFLLVAREAGLNILKYSKKGRFRFYKIKEGYKLVFEDFENLLDIKKAFLKGYSSSKTLGIGLNLLINIVDEMSIIPTENGKVFEFVIYTKEKKEYCVFKKEYNDLMAFLKVSPFLTITTSGDCGLFEKANRYYFALWDVAGHGSYEIYKFSMELKKYIYAFRYFELEDVVGVVNYLFNKEAACVIGEIVGDKIRFYHFGNIRYFYKKAFYVESEFLGKAKKFRLIELKRGNVSFFSDGIDLKEEITDFYQLSSILRNKNEDDASILAIKVK